MLAFTLKTDRATRYYRDPVGKMNGQETEGQERDS